MLSARWLDAAVQGAPSQPLLNYSESDWRTIVSTRPNALIEGPMSAVWATIDRLVAELPRPAVAWTPALDDTGDAKTVVVEEVALLDDAEQRSLLTFAAATAARVQIISTSTTRVYDAVLGDSFTPDLYYQLNVVLMTVS